MQPTFPFDPTDFLLQVLAAAGYFLGVIVDSIPPGAKVLLAGAVVLRIVLRIVLPSLFRSAPPRRSRRRRRDNW